MLVDDANMYFMLLIVLLLVYVIDDLWSLNTHHTPPPTPPLPSCTITSHYRYVTTLVETIQYYSGHFQHQEEQLSRHVSSWVAQCDDKIKSSLDKLHTIKKAVALSTTPSRPSPRIEVRANVVFSVSYLIVHLYGRIFMYTIYSNPHNLSSYNGTSEDMYVQAYPVRIVGGCVENILSCT